MKKMIIKHWEGKYTLAQSYWIGCILIPIVLILPLLPAFMGDAATMSSALIWFSLIYWGALFFANIFLKDFIVIGISSFRYPNSPSPIALSIFLSEPINIWKPLGSIEDD